MEYTFDLNQENLYSRNGLQKLDNLFLEEAKRRDPSLFQKLMHARSTELGDSELVIELSYLLEEFVARIFDLKEEIGRSKELQVKFLELYKCKRTFVQRYALRKYTDLNTLDIEEIISKIANFFDLPIEESSFVQKINFWLQDQEQYEKQLDVAAQYAAYMVYRGAESILFQVPKKQDFANLVPIDEIHKDGITVKISPTIHQRIGFNITKTPTQEYSSNEMHYCIICHKQNRDSCSKGMTDNRGNVKLSPLQIPMGGCPLRVKISEANLLKSQGLVIAPLAIITVDNPMCALTGYRICNDCTRSCIYQKQQPVDVPSIETHILDCVLNLRYGFEIYSLLTRWQPLAFKNVLPKKSTTKNVLIVGLGPAGISLSHHLLNEGHNVVAVDGLKIEPLPEHLSGVSRCNKKTEFSLIKHVKSELFDNLEHRPAYGFGGVSEYGITARWNKNYLKIARLLLERRANFFMYGGISFGNTLSLHDVFSLGFHHIALATGAGSPRIPKVKNILANGVLTASSFLMSLHLGNAAHKDSITNLQIRLPAVVVGGGLTAVDTATELLAYYPVQVEMLLSRYETLVEKFGQELAKNHWSAEEQAILHEFLDHARELRKEKALAHEEGRSPEILQLLNQWGGVTIVYRDNFHSSTAYRLNSEELKYALFEGIQFAENLQLSEIVLDQNNRTKGIKAIDKGQQEVYIPARTVILAIGTDEGHTTLGNSLADAHGESSLGMTIKSTLNNSDSFFISESKTISAFGDLHPYYRGSVVKAIASSKQGYAAITKTLERYPPCTNTDVFFQTINELFSSQVTSVIPLTKSVVELTIRSPLASYNFKPGQFYRLQNLEKCGNDKARFSMEGVAVTGASVDKKCGTITVVVLDTGGSSKLCRYFKAGQPVSFMGPTGCATELLEEENVALIGGGVGNAVLFSIGKALSHKCNVLYFAGFRNSKSIFSMSSIEQASSVTVWCCESEEIIPRRPQDIFLKDTVVGAIMGYHNLRNTVIKLHSIDRIIMVGSSGMMSALSDEIFGKFKSFFKTNVKVIASINSPMQCMMKGICGQCIQKHIDPLSAEESFVYSCVNQDQCSQKVDFSFLESRLKQNSVLEKCTSIWVAHCLGE